METVTLTQTEASAAAAGAIFGGAIATVGIIVLIVYILEVIAMWKIFAKAGEAGWKSLIPIYNAYIFCKIVKVNFWIYCLLVPFVVGLLAGIIFKDNQDTQSIISSVYVAGLEIYLAIMLGRAFKKGPGFIVGLILLPNIFQLILAFGGSKYALKKGE